jgi:hypothetical protein
MEERVQHTDYPSLSLLGSHMWLRQGAVHTWIFEQGQSITMTSVPLYAAQVDSGLILRLIYLFAPVDFHASSLRSL